MTERAQVIKNLIKQKNGLCVCTQHKNQEIKWICSEEGCAERIICEACMIQKHIKTHQNFCNFYKLLEDPLQSLKGAKRSTPTVDSEYFEAFKNYINEQERNIDLIREQVLTQINNKFDELKVRIRVDLEEFLTNQERDFKEFNSINQNLREFCDNLLSETDISQIDKLKHFANQIVEKFKNDPRAKTLNPNFSIDSLGVLEQRENLKISFDNIHIDELKWKFFEKVKKNDDFETAAKEPSEIQTFEWKFDEALFASDFSFTNEGFTAKKIPLPFFSSLTSATVMKSGRFTWSIIIDVLNINVGHRLYLGIVPFSKNFDHRTDCKNTALCIGSNGESFNIVHSDGNVGFGQGEFIELALDFNSRTFLVKSDNFLYMANIEGGVFKPYIGFSEGSDSQITLLR